MKKVELDKLINEEIECLEIDELRVLKVYRTIQGEKCLSLCFKSCLPLSTSISSSFTINIVNHAKIVEEIRIATENYFHNYVRLMNSNKILPNWY